MVAYRVRHIYWIFRWVTERVPYMICGNCGAEHSADEGDYDSPETKGAISKWDRLGWAIGAGGIGALIATGSVAMAFDKAANQTEIATPRIGDVYETNLAKLVTKPEAPVMFGAMRVVKVSATEVELEVSNTYYTDSRGVERDMREGKTADESYYGGNHLNVPKASLEKMYADGAVTDVSR
jgi:hypothetical protein